MSDISKEMNLSTPPSATGSRPVVVSSIPVEEGIEEATVSVLTSDKKRKSPYWDHFNMSEEENVVKCKHCTRAIHSSAKNGTSGMKNHLQRCARYPANLDKKQKLIDFQSETVTDEHGKVQTVSVPKLWKFDKEHARRELCKMIIVDELPFIIVERQGLRDYSKALNVEFVLPSRQTIARDCYKLFIEERRKLASSLQNLSSRICLTTDTWTSGNNLCFMSLTAHFIDHEWKLHKRILNFCPIAGHSGVLIGRAVEKCLTEWGLKKILTITLDNASANDSAIQYLRGILNHWGGSVLDGKFLQVRCAAHVLNLVVKDGLKELNASIIKTRIVVRYVRSSPARLQRFLACVKEKNIMFKGFLCLDVETRWNYTFLMIESALKFRKAFDNLKLKDAQYVKEFVQVGGSPCDADWEKVKSFVPILKIFYDATLKLSGCHYVTGNYYIPQLFGVGYMIFKKSTSDDPSLRQMASQMKAKFDKYWGNIDKVNILLYVALVLDPRQKWNYTEWVVTNSYDSERATLLISHIQHVIQSLFNSYKSSLPPPKVVEATKSGSHTSIQSSYCDDEEIIDVQELLKMEYKKKMGTSGSDKKSELEKYYADDCEHDETDFDVLLWWKDQNKRYPILAMIARDVLAIPVTSVASESAFSTGGRVLDSFRTSLTTRMVEGIICTQDWLRNSKDPISIEESLSELAKMEEEGLKEWTVEQPTISIDETISSVDDY